MKCNEANYTKGRGNKKVEYIVVHYTGNKNDTAKNNCKYFAKNKVNASAHYFVDSKEWCNSVPEEDMAWHCGAKTYKHPHCRNNNSIGIELCTNYNDNFYFEEDTITNAIELVAILMHKYNVPLDKVVRHYDVTGKKCPLPLIDEQKWQAFKILLKREVNNMSEVKQIKSKVKIEGKVKEVECINYNGKNYYHLSTIINLLKFTGLDYDSNTKTTIIKGE